jgi:F1F0 ATPase subunit 2
MNELLTLVLALVAGIPLGIFFFGGLWWTVKKGIASQRPALWFFGSLLIRIGVTMAGFYVVALGHWERVIMCLSGFLIARAIITRFIRTSSANQVHLAKEGNHEN